MEVQVEVVRSHTCTTKHYVLHPCIIHLDLEGFDDSHQEKVLVKPEGTDPTFLVGPEPVWGPGESKGSVHFRRCAADLSLYWLQPSPVHFVVGELLTESPEEVPLPVQPLLAELSAQPLLLQHLPVLLRPGRQPVSQLPPQAGGCGHLLPAPAITWNPLNSPDVSTCRWPQLRPRRHNPGAQAHAPQCLGFLGLCGNPQPSSGQVFWKFNVFFGVLEVDNQGKITGDCS